ncbi:hypothetical protein [Pyrobaculum aerophilum]|uniref:Uncharacterized protein n=1 Tax=Pyrobaculum aerophilum TaxID=13773 RepID=A0A371QZD4_9CREN|nr:hypothetical protein [Pyrobaculum aerophilum]RFA96063.1 hypothetical protein CGL52_11690 [Pyrobaculum aerophilum]RFA96796.1 hypothetical protein CGL51_04615 [Pyrobaculum aerophilum]
MSSRKVLRMSKIRMPSKVNRYLYAALLALLITALAVSMYVIAATGISPVTIEREGPATPHYLAPKKSPKTNKAPFADKEVVDMVRETAERAVPGGRLIAAYKHDDENITAVVLRGDQLYGVEMSVNKSVKVRRVIKGSERLFDVVREEKSINTTEGVNATLITAVSIYEVTIPTNKGDIYLYKVIGQIGRRSESHSFGVVTIYDGTAVVAYFTNFLPNEMIVVAAGLWIIDAGRAVLYLEDRSYTDSSGPVDLCSFTSSANYNEYAGGVKASAVYAMLIGPTTRKAQLTAWLTYDKYLNAYPDGHANTWVSTGFGCVSWP